MVSASPMIAPTVMRGLSEANGSWKMICMSRQSARNAAASSAVTLRPSNQTSPAVGSIRRRMQRPVVDLPQPDSPTRPSVSPGAMSKLTPSTACTTSALRAEQAAADREVLDQVLDAQERLNRLAHRAAISSAGSIEHAGDLVAAADLAQRRHRLAALRHRVAAARREAAAGRRLEQARHHARDRLEPRLLRRRRVDARDRADQALRVGMARIGEQLARPALPRPPCRHTSRPRAARSRRPRPSRG